MDISLFTDGLKGLVEKTPLFPRENLIATVIINPNAGGFSRPARFAAALQDVALANSATALHPARGGSMSWRVISTESPRHATRIASECIEEAAMKPGTTWLVILACGDGTSLEFLDELSRAPDELRNVFTVLRLPMGTGNDGSDGRELSDSLSRLTGSGEVAVQAILRVIPAPGGPACSRARGGEWRSFNIASIGLDAYVTDMTNRLKVHMPGDSYKLWMDLAALFYDKVYPPREMGITAMDSEGKETGRLEGRFLLALMGVSGYRTYGSNKKILPDKDNACAVHQMPLLRKLALKGPMTSGHIRDFQEAVLFSADAIEFRYGDRILVQMDGEAELLVPEDFPLRMERTPPLIRHLARVK
jgi:diacylglycerol kinase family enzyme